MTPLEQLYVYEMETVKRIGSFRSLGMFDPTDSEATLEDALSYIQQIDYRKEVYLNLKMEACAAAFGPNSVKPPKSIFMPTRKFIRKMMRAMIKYGR